MGQQFKCPEPNCPHNVEYVEEDPHNGVNSIDEKTVDFDATTKTGPKRVYLVCPLGHSYPYVVSS